MDIASKLSVGVNTTVVGMGIVFIVLIALAVIIVLQTKIIQALGSLGKKDMPAAQAVPETIPGAPRSGKSAGEVTLEDVDDETAAVILAVVSEDAGIPIGELNVKSIRAL